MMGGNRRPPLHCAHGLGPTAAVCAQTRDQRTCCTAWAWRGQQYSTELKWRFHQAYACEGTATYLASPNSVGRLGVTLLSDVGCKYVSRCAERVSPKRCYALQMCRCKDGVTRMAEGRIGST